ncbi:hypothetical protein FB451DRAFT_1414409 [Mycena latifolia]|nr:hypothetical protein FB451DRAFT_1414409 [Mycena latifolia]
MEPIHQSDNHNEEPKAHGRRRESEENPNEENARPPKRQRRSPGIAAFLDLEAVEGAFSEDDDEDEANLDDFILDDDSTPAERTRSPAPAQGATLLQRAQSEARDAEALARTFQQRARQQRQEESEQDRRWQQRRQEKAPAPLSDGNIDSETEEEKHRRLLRLHDPDRRWKDERDINAAARIRRVEEEAYRDRRRATGAGRPFPGRGTLHWDPDTMLEGVRPLPASQRPITLTEEVDLRLHQEAHALDTHARVAGFRPYQWVRLLYAHVRKEREQEKEQDEREEREKGLPMGTLAMIQSTSALWVLMPKKTSRTAGGAQGYLFKELRLHDRRLTMEKCVKLEPAPTLEELAKWDLVAGAEPALRAAPSHQLGTALEVGCRVLVRHTHNIHRSKSGFICDIYLPGVPPHPSVKEEYDDDDEQETDEQKQKKARQCTRALVRQTRFGTPFTQSDPDIAGIVDARGERDDFIVPMKDLRRHALSSPCRLAHLDRVRLPAEENWTRELDKLDKLPEQLTRENEHLWEWRADFGPVGHVSSVDSMDEQEDAEVSFVTEDGTELRARMSDVWRHFKPGDHVKVVSGHYRGNEGIVLTTGRYQGGTDVIDLTAPAGVMEIFLSAGHRATELGLRTNEPGSIKVLNVQVEFATEGGMLGGAWSLPSTVPAMPPSPLRHAQEDRKREDEQRTTRALKQALRLKGTEVIVVGINEGNRNLVRGVFQTHAAKGTVGVIIDVHEKTAASSSSSSAVPLSSSLVFSVKQELTDQVHQVPEILLRHRWTGLTLRDFNVVSPWARPLNWTWWKDGSSWKDSAWAESRRTPPLETCAPGPSAPPVEPPPAREIGDDDGRWLCIPRLKDKRVDVKVMNKTRGRVSAVQSQAMGNHGYIELVDALTESQLNTPIPVYVYFKDRQKEKKVMLEPRWLTPMRQTLCPPHMMADVSIVERRGRVVIIGPSDSGDRSRMGEYGETIPESSSDAVWVRLEGRNETTAHFPVQSLCRLQNVDTGRTKATRFGVWVADIDARR